MIKHFFATAMIVTAVILNPVFANNGDTSLSITRQVNINSPVKKVIIYGNVDVILTRERIAEISIEGYPAFANGVEFVNRGSKLEIVAKEYSGSNKPLIRIPVQQLESLEFHGDGKISTTSVLRIKKLSVFIDGVCEVAISSTGKIFIESSSKYELTYIKNEKRKLISYVY